MGLDMYLEARKYVSQDNWSNGDRTPNPDYATLVSLAPKGLADNVQFGGGSVSLTVGYWRKANAIHGWIINNSGAVDDCTPIHVSKNALIQLRDDCQKVLDEGTVETALELLPPASGFFFGSTEIDDWYWQDIKETVTKLTEIINSTIDDQEFEYHASW